ncbi:hypothetical protein [Capnocytophaga catalasegens]|uniref:DUF4177 domain-containing protein n=1 Tax=Capnocytophaga catalasegens TaxID=1004260 RepID=A0AAV5ARG2_9FLAO|nr:hypothetical protein [Capnocytophaga catalasegens]GIZ16362.1 hypothetical protein RCZ03_23620 [Capnocytophaga catalasegens]GJM49903.1 hypothetical protein RCZ15_08780 [Capnocytophaga catalasegens]GJM54254.1 hypothetical protein RCZ16_25700 [Capnocytophaga catalasegens]
MQKEIILTEVVFITPLSRGEYTATHTFPTIQKHLDEGYVVKSIFYSPAKEVGYTNGFALTVHLKKPEEIAK